MATNEMKQVVDEQLSFAFPNSKLNHIKTYNQVIDKLTSFLQKRSEKVPTVNFKTVDELLNWLIEHDMISLMLKEFCGDFRKINEQSKDPIFQKVLLRPLISYLFNIMDMDNNHCITSDELLAYIAINLCENSNLRNELIFRKFDKNGDNRLTKEEFEQFFYMRFKMFCFSIIADDLLFVQPLKIDINEAVDAVDYLNSVPTNSIKEFFCQDIDSVMTTFENNCKSKMIKVQKIAEECFRTVDLNHDGYISLNELQNKFTDGFFSTREKFIKKVKRLIIKDMFHYFMDENEIKYQAKKRSLFCRFHNGVSPDELVKKHTPNFESI